MFGQGVNEVWIAGRVIFIGYLSTMEHACGPVYHPKTCLNAYEK